MPAFVPTQATTIEFEPSDTIDNVIKTKIHDGEQSRFGGGLGGGMQIFVKRLIAEIAALDGGYD